MAHGGAESAEHQPLLEILQLLDNKVRGFRVGNLGNSWEIQSMLSSKVPLTSDRMRAIPNM